MLMNFLEKCFRYLLYGSSLTKRAKNAISIITLLIRVANAAPFTPIGLNPRCPYISAQFRIIFTAFAKRVIYIAYFVMPIPSENCLRPKKTIKGKSEKRSVL